MSYDHNWFTCLSSSCVAMNCRRNNDGSISIKPGQFLGHLGPGTLEFAPEICKQLSEPRFLIQCEAAKQSLSPLLKSALAHELKCRQGKFTLRTPGFPHITTTGVSSTTEVSTFKVSPVLCISACRFRQTLARFRPQLANLVNIGSTIPRAASRKSYISSYSHTTSV